MFIRENIRQRNGINMENEESNKIFQISLATFLIEQLFKVTVPRDVYTHIWERRIKNEENEEKEEKKEKKE
jgi:hypothetical protein